MSAEPDPQALTDVRASRRKLMLDGFGISVSVVGFGLIFGLSARAAGLSPLDATAMSVLVFAGASQFAAVGYIAGGLPWLGVVLATGLINARHFLYSAALAPYFAQEGRVIRAVRAHVLTDEAFALSIAHFTRIGRTDSFGYWWSAIAVTFIPWNIASLVGVLIGGAIPDPARFGLDVIFPAAMAGLAVALIVGRRELVAALSGAVMGVAVGLALDPAVGLVAGGLFGPLVAISAVRRTPGRDDQPSPMIIFGPPD